MVKFKKSVKRLNSKWFETVIDALDLQLDLDAVVQNIITVDTNSDEEPDQFWGFSAGFILNYLIPISSKVRLAPFSQLQTESILNLSAGYRHLFMSETLARGGMWEIGITWRFTSVNLGYYKFTNRKV